MNKNEINKSNENKINKNEIKKRKMLIYTTKTKRKKRK